MKSEKFLCRVPRDQETASASKKLSASQKSQGIMAPRKRETVIVVSEKRMEEYEKAKKERDEALKDVGRALKKVIKCQGEVNKKDPRFPNKIDPRVF